MLKLQSVKALWVIIVSDLHILDYPWHQVHLYRMVQCIDATFTVAMIRYPVWNNAQRPIPENVNFIERENIPSGNFDVAILHLDQWCDRLNLRALPFRIMKQSTQNSRQVIIMHGTPDSRGNREAILRLIGDLPVVCNSRQAADEWDAGEDRECRYGFRQFTPIIHGYVDEFFNYDLERRLGAGSEVITICSGGTLSYEYHGLPLLERLRRDVPIVWYGPKGDRGWKSSYPQYRHMLASSLVYFSPTRRAPMPGSRTEAMLSGCCIVSVPGNDFEDYITNGVNGFIVNTYEQARLVIRTLIADPAEAYAIGQCGRETALMFSRPDMYRRDWMNLLENMGVSQF